MNRAAKFVRDRYRNLLPAKTIKLPPSFKQFYSRLVPSFALDILSYLGTFDDKLILGDFIDELYRTVVAMIDLENHLAIERGVSSLARSIGKQFALSRIHTEHSLHEIRLAQKALGTAARVVFPGLLPFDELRKGLEQLRQVLTELENDTAYLIPQSSRTARERILAPRSRFTFEHSPLSKSEKSADFQYYITERFEKTILRYTRKKVPSNHVDQFIASLFQVGLGRTITPENVKTMRIRNRKRTKGPSPTQLFQTASNSDSTL